jgi:FkbM family methyltransferase
MARLGNKIRGLKEIWQFDNRWQIALNRILFPTEPLQVYRYKGLDILIDHSAGDANGVREVLTSDMYRRYLPEIKLQGRLNVFDLGANNGGFPLLLKAAGFDIARVVSVELNPQTFERLRFNLTRNFDSSCLAINCAVTGESRNVRFRPGRNGSAADSIYSPNGNGPTADVTVAGRTFDQLFHESFGNEMVDICKIDIEGAEFEIAGHGTWKQLARVRYLLIEIHHFADSPRGLVVASLNDLGFEEINGAEKNDEFHHVHFFKNGRISC